MPLMVSLMAAFTSAVAFMPRLVTRRANARKPAATPKMIGMNANKSNVSFQSVRKSTIHKMKALSKAIEQVENENDITDR